MGAFERMQGYSSMNRGKARNVVHEVFDINTPSGVFLAAVHGHGYKLFNVLYDNGTNHLSEEQFNALPDDQKQLYERKIEYTELYNVLTTYGNQKISAAAGAGKALVHGEAVLTDKGYMPVEHIEIGDRVYGTDGYLHIVIGVYPQGRRTAYEVMFDDGNSVYCSGDHLWTVSNDNGETWVDMKTEDRGIEGHVIPMAQPLHFEDTDSRIRFIKDECDCLDLEYVRQFLKAPVPVREEFVRYVARHFNEVYHRYEASFPTNDIMDTFMQICESIGVWCRVLVRVDKTKIGLLEVDFNRKRKIVSVEAISGAEATCIEVDSADHLFLIGHCIATHNTTSLIFKIMYDIVTGEAMTLKALPNGTSVPVVNKMWVCTFLKSGAEDLSKTLAKWQRKLGYSQTSAQVVFSTLDAEFKRCLNAMGAATPIGDTSKLLNKAINSCNITRKGYPLKKEDFQIISGIVDWYRGRLDGMKYQHPSCDDYGLTPSMLDLLVKQFSSLKSAEGIMDFDDVQELLYKYLYVTPNPAIQEFVANRYNYIYIDEFQDTSQLQYAILKFYARGKLWLNRDGVVHEDDVLYTGEETKGKIVVIGDVSQCITGDTEITMPGGSKCAEDVEVGDIVRIPCGTGVVQSVTKTALRGTGFINSFETSTGKRFRCTDGHKLFARIDTSEDYEFIYLSYDVEDDRYEVGYTVDKNCIGGDKAWLLAVHKHGEHNTIGICDEIRSKLEVEGIGAVFEGYCNEGFSLPYHTSKDMGAVISYELEELGKADAIEGYYSGTQVVRRVLFADGNIYTLLSASQVHEGMHVWTEDGDEEITGKYTSEGDATLVYDFDIEGSHVFYAGGVLVHNCIYSFKGSDSKILAEHFDNDFRPVNSALSCNWRCPSNILNPVVPSIHKNVDSASQGIYSSKEGGEFHVYELSSIKSMGDRLLKDLKEDMSNNKNVAILCRTNFDGMIPAFILEANGRFNFSVSGDNMTLSSALPRDLIKVAKMFTDKATPAVRNTLKWLVGYREQYQVNALMDAMKGSNKSVWTVPEADLQYSAPAIYDIIKQVKGYFYENGKRVKENEIKALEALYWLIRQKAFGGDSTYCENARSCIDVLLYILQTKEFDGVYDFIEEMELIAEKLKGRVRKTDAPIRIATVHEFKGKECDSVIIWNDTEGVFPSSKCDIGNLEQLEEERRVHYIACTRAKDVERIYTVRGAVGMFLYEMDCKFESGSSVRATLGGSDGKDGQGEVQSDTAESSKAV